MELALAFLAVLLLVVAADAFLRHHAPRDGHDDASATRATRPRRKRREDLSSRALRWVYHARGTLVAPPLAFAALFFRLETENDWLVWPVGTLAVGLGVALRIWAQAHIRFRLKGHRHLTTSGPYATVRNPLYIANTLICVGATIVSELLWVVPVTLAWCAVVYSLVVRQEEARLAKKYGEAYHRYVSAVPRWVPRTLPVQGLGQAREHLRAALLVEAPCLLILLPYVGKELVSPWFEH